MARFRMIMIGVVLVVIVAVLVFGGRGERGPEVELGRAESRELFRSYVTASGEILAERYADVGSSVMGRVVELPVAEGQEVSGGDLLARIDPVQARSELEAAEAVIQALRAEAQSATEQIVLSRADLELAGNLDSTISGEIMELFDQLNQNGNTVILVTHENDIAAHAHRTVTLRDGKIISDEKTQ